MPNKINSPNKPIAFEDHPQKKIIPTSFLIFVASLWMLGTLASDIKWSYAKSNVPISVVAVQANIPQELKWRSDYRLKTIEIYQSLSAPHWGKNLIIWPETAIPLLYDEATSFNQAKPITNRLSKLASSKGSTLISGIPYRGLNPETERVNIHNSIISMGKGDGIYHKQKLVPFGEYIPLESMLRGLISFFDLPMSSFSIGPSEQSPLKESIRHVIPYICYEIVYPDFVAKSAHTADYLLTISNDSWFGSSIGPLQHLEMAQMRALENARYVVRGTNNGISAIIGPNGKIQNQTEQFIRTVLTGEIYALGGRTPFSYFGSIPVLLVCGLILITRRLLYKPSSTQTQAL